MTPQRLTFTVSQLNAEVNQLLRDSLPPLWVEGEISNLSRPSSGHLYFSLKDDDAQLRCALFKNRSNIHRRPNLENGQKVLAYGTIGLYEPRGDYQFIVETIEDAGLGRLQQQFEALKKKLQQQGLFADEHKKPLPRFPRCIGVITSPSGAALQDVLNVLGRRCPQIPVLVYPVLVQGDQAAPQIAAAIQRANTEQQCDVLLVVRGGGSLEDLWAFNEEIVAHAIFASTIPIVSGVGHEVDFTITDFVADYRAPTPSAAAEIISPDTEAWLAHIERLQQHLFRLQQQAYKAAAERVQGLEKRLWLQHPRVKLQQKAQRLDDLELRLQQALNWRLQTASQRSLHAEQRLLAQSPARLVGQQQRWLAQLDSRLLRAWQQQTKAQQGQLQQLAGRLQTLSPLATLQRGYSVLQNSERKVVTSVKQVAVGEPIFARLSDGELRCEVR